MFIPRCYIVFIPVAFIIIAVTLSLHEMIIPSVFAADAKTNQSTNNTPSQIPPVKFVYANHTYEMLPFVVVDQDGVKKLNFPHLADEYKPLAQISSDATFNLQFASKPREVNAFGIDYDADTTEVNPLTKVGKYQYTFGKLNGVLTLEVRAIYDDGKYVTYTGLIKINKPSNGSGDLGQQSTPSGNQQSTPSSNQSGIPDIFS
jgi:hypothetical protein